MTSVRHQADIANGTPTWDLVCTNNNNYYYYYYYNYYYYYYYSERHHVVGIVYDFCKTPG